MTPELEKYHRRFRTHEDMLLFMRCHSSGPDAPEFPKDKILTSHIRRADGVFVPNPEWESALYEMTITQIAPAMMTTKI